MLQLLNEAVATKNKLALHNWIKAFTGIHIPKSAVCHNHCAPFDFVAATLFGEYQQAIARANRSGGKTLSFAIIESVETFRQASLEAANVGAIQAQAERCYAYVKEFSDLFPFNTNVESLTATKGSFRNGSSLQILAGTPKGVNAPHPQLLMIDELELMNPFVVQQALSMPQSKADIRARTIITSTVKFAVGLMLRMIEEFKTMDLPVFEWCVWETMQPLPTDNPALLRRIRETFGDELPATINRADGYYDWDDLIAKKLSLDPEVWNVEWVCKEPERSGLVYPQFSLEANVINPDNPRPEYREPYQVNPWLPIYVLEDVGFGPNNPNVNLFAQVVKNDLVIFDELYNHGQISDDIIPQVQAKLASYGYALTEARPKEGSSVGWIIDPAALTEAEERRRRGIRVMAPVLDRSFYRLENRIPLLRKKIADRTLQLGPNCGNLTDELLSYRNTKTRDGLYTDVPEKKNDHGPDALGYGALILFPVLAQGALGRDVAPTQQKPLAAGIRSRTY